MRIVSNKWVTRLVFWDKSVTLNCLGDRVWEMDDSAQPSYFVFTCFWMLVLISLQKHNSSPRLPTKLFVIYLTIMANARHVIVSLRLNVYICYQNSFQFCSWSSYKEDYVGIVLPCSLCVKVVENWNPPHIKENEPLYEL